MTCRTPQFSVGQPKPRPSASHSLITPSLTLTRERGYRRWCRLQTAVHATIRFFCFYERALLM